MSKKLMSRMPCERDWTNSKPITPSTPRPFISSVTMQPPRFLRSVYGQKELPEIKAIAQRRGQRVLNQLIEPFLRKQPTAMDCSDYERLLPLTLYARRYFTASDDRTVQIIDRTNADFGHAAHYPVQSASTTGSALGRTT
jgi:hypothetical protein